MMFPLRLLHRRPGFLLAVSLGSAVVISAQTLYVPSGTAGIGVSTTSNVGIGTTTPSTKLDVVGALRLGNPTTQSNYFAVISPRYDSNHPFSIGVENNTGGTASEVLGVYSPGGGGYVNLALGLNGNVGIGTTSPVAKFDLVAGARQEISVYTPSAASGISDFAMGGVGWVFSRPDDGALTQAIYSYNSTGGAKNNLAISSRSDIIFTAGNAGPNAAPERMRIAENGYVGIGVDAPQAKLQIGRRNLIKDGTWAPPTAPDLTSAGERIVFYQDGGWKTAIGMDVQNGIWFQAHTPGGQVAYQWFTGAVASDPVERMRIVENGKVGIGLIDPRWRLGVADGVEVRADDADSKLTFHDPGQVWYTMGIDYSDNRSFKLGLGGNVGDVTDVTLTPGGNFGLGTSSPQTQLDVVSSDFYLARFVGLANTNQAILIGNASQANYMNIGIGGATVTSGVPYIWSNNGKFMIGNDGSPVFFVSGQGTTDGKIGIRTTNPTHPLTVNGTIRAREIIVDNTAWSDYVFSPDYRLPALSEVEAQIKAHKHLPGIPSGREVAEHGVSVGEMQARLLAKIEELTLHVIAQDKRIAAQQAEIRALRDRLAP